MIHRKHLRELAFVGAYLTSFRFAVVGELVGFEPGETNLPRPERSTLEALAPVVFLSSLRSSPPSRRPKCRPLNHPCDT